MQPSIEQTVSSILQALQDSEMFIQFISTLFTINESYDEVRLFY